MLVTILMGVCLNMASSAPADTGRPVSLDQLREFTRKLGEHPTEALPAARALFDRWCKAAPSNGSLRLFRQRLAALSSLREEIVRQLQTAGREAVGKFVKGLWEEERPQQAAVNAPLSIAIVPAEQLYRLYLPHFRFVIDTRELHPTEKEFLKAYYNAEVQAAVSEIMRLGRPLAAAVDKRFLELEYYLILLPLLHNTTQFSVESLRELPSWMLASEHLKILADFCLFRAGRLDAAEAIGLSLKDQKPTLDARYGFYTEAAGRCVAAHSPGTAVDCLRTALSLLDPRELRAIELRFQICEVWAGTKNWALAAGEAGQLARDFPDSAEAGRAMFQRIKYLMTQGDAQTVLHEVDDAIQNQYCRDMLPDLNYYKWKALRRLGRGQAASLLLKQFLERYPQDPNGAEMHFAVACDCLSAQRYDEALTILESLGTRYPQSPFARQAQQLIEKLYQLHAKSDSRPASEPAAPPAGHRTVNRKRDGG